jgi:hypothetical protein
MFVITQSRFEHSTQAGAISAQYVNGKSTLAYYRPQIEVHLVR